MNTDKKLNKIHQELQEVALEMEISNARPKERRGDYTIIKRPSYKKEYDSGGIYIGQFITNPHESAPDPDLDFDDLDWQDEPPELQDDIDYWIADVIIEENSHYYLGGAKKYYKIEVDWDSYNKKWHWLDPKRMWKRVKTPRNWNPPKKLLRIIENKLMKDR